MAAVSIHFERNAVVRAARQKSSNVQFGKPRNAKLAVLLGVHKLVKEKPICKRLVRDRGIAERDRRHLREVGQIRESYANQHGVERRILKPDALQNQNSHTIGQLAV